MPDANNKPLPPLEEEAFEHGDKYSTELVENKCSHKGVKRVSSLEIRCSCGAAWSGVGIDQLLKAFQNQ